MNANYEYFISQNLERYSGSWVVIVKEKVIAHGPRARMKEMLERAKKTYPDEPLLVAKIPGKILQVLQMVT